MATSCMEKTQAPNEVPLWASIFPGFKLTWFLIGGIELEFPELTCAHTRVSLWVKGDNGVWVDGEGPADATPRAFSCRKMSTSDPSLYPQCGPCFKMCERFQCSFLLSQCGVCHKSHVLGVPCDGAAPLLWVYVTGRDNVGNGRMVP